MTFVNCNVILEKSSLCRFLGRNVCSGGERRQARTLQFASSRTWKALARFNSEADGGKVQRGQLSPSATRPHPDAVASMTDGRCRPQAASHQNPLPARSQSLRVVGAKSMTALVTGLDMFALPPSSHPMFKLGIHRCRERWNAHSASTKKTCLNMPPPLLSLPETHVAIK